MSKYEFQENELITQGYVPNRNRPGEPGKPVLNYPCTEREAMNSLYRREALWIPYGVETNRFCPEIIPDNIARGFVLGAESVRYNVKDYGGPDMFGVEWVYVPVAGGSMEKPGAPHPLGEDVFDWKKKLTFPNIDSWDWDRSARENKKWLQNNKSNVFCFLNGMGFERLISFLGFENAAMALIDEEQEDELMDLLESLTDLHIRMIDKVCETYGDAIDGFNLHDDWGSQKAPFFSEECAEKFLVPQMKRFTDYVKAKGRYTDLHSCGHIETRIQSIINAGWQSWTPMAMNDTLKLQEMYGEQIIISCVPDYDPEKSAEENAADFVRKYYRPDRPCMLSNYAGEILSEEYCKAVYKFSREKSIEDRCKSDLLIQGE